MRTNPFSPRLASRYCVNADTMALAAVGRAPIVDSEGRLVGLVSRRDLLRARVHFRVAELERQRLLRPPLPGAWGRSATAQGKR